MNFPSAPSFTKLPKYISVSARTKLSGVTGMPSALEVGVWAWAAPTMKMHSAKAEICDRITMLASRRSPISAWDVVYAQPGRAAREYPKPVVADIRTRRATPANEKPRPWGPGFSNATELTRSRPPFGGRQASRLHGRDSLRDDALEPLVGVLGQSGVELAHLGELGDGALERGLDVVGLDLERLVEGLHAGELLERGGASLEGLLGVVGCLDGDRLHALGGGAESLQSGIDVLFGSLLDGVELLDHGSSPEHLRCHIR